MWLIDMDDALDRFVASLPDSVRHRLDFSDASLDVLEECLLSKYKDVSATRDLAESAFLDGAARYIGEVFRKRTGAKWAIQYDDPNDVFHGLPVLKGGSKIKVPICPLTLVTASTSRRTGKYFSTVLSRLSA